ncbi:MAG: hypothetical protein IPK07_06230 [Deltaproteobacteria bacterium]|nr:hypothetical protein [Deltaproteobacteria bacterium]
MTQPSGTSDPTTGVTNSKSGRVVDGKLVLWTDKGEPRVIRPVSVENKKLFVDAESMLSLGARAELELPPAGEGEARSRVRVEVVYSNPGKGSTTLRRGMLLAFPDLTDELLARVNAAIAQAPRTSTIPEPAPEKPKPTKEDDTVYSKVPIAEPAAARSAPEPARRAESTRTNGSRRARKGGSLLWVPVVLALALAGVLGYFRYEDWLDHQNATPAPVPGPVRVPKRAANPSPEIKPPAVDPRYTAYVAPAREAAEALLAGDAPTLEGKLATAEKLVSALQPEPASLRGLRAGREALRLRDTALDNIGQVRSLEGTAWGKGSNTPYRTKETFLKAQEARISVTKTTSADLANETLAILRAAEPWKAELDPALQDRIERTVRMLQLSQ